MSGAADFEGLLRSALRFTPSRARVTVRHEHRLGGPSHFYESVHVNFVNLPEGAGGGGGGAEAENNRMSFWIHGFYGAEPHASPPSGKVKIEHANSALPREYRLRGKSGKPEVIAKYLADFLNRVVAEVPPRWTHTSPAGAAKHESGGNPRTTRSKKPKAKFASGDFVTSVRVTKTPDFAPVASGSLAKIIRSDKETGRYFVMWAKSEKTGWYHDDLFERADAGLGARHERGGNPHVSPRFYIVFRGKIGRVVASQGEAEKIAFDDYDGKTRVVGEAGLRALGLDPNRQADWTVSRSAPSAARHERGGNPSLMGFRSPPKEIAHGFKMRVVLGAKNAGLSTGKMTHRNVFFGSSGREFAGKEGTAFSRKASLYEIPVYAGSDTIGFAQLYLHPGGGVDEQLATANRTEVLSSLDFGWLASKSAQFRGLGKAGGAVSVKDAALKAKVKSLVGGRK